MAGELQVDYASGNTIYDVIRNLVGLVWYVSGQVFEAWGTSSRTAADYAITLSGDAGDRYIGDFDINISDGRYTTQSFLQAGGSPVDSDTYIDTDFHIWEDGVRVFAPSAKEIWDEIITKAAHNIGNSAAKILRETNISITADTAQGPGTGNNQIQLASGASAVDGAYDPAVVFIKDGTGVGQSRNITQYGGSSKTATVDRNWKVNPAADSEYVILADAGREHVNEGLAQAGNASPATITLNTLASPIDDAYRNQLVFVRSGTGEDQVRRVKSYVGSTRVATVSRAWGVVPDSTSGYVILPMACVEVQAVGTVELEDKVGSNFNTFFQNGDSDTTRIVDNVLDVGAGAIEWTYNLLSTVDPFPPIADADVWVSSDSAGLNVLASGRTDANGNVTFYLDAGTVYVWRQKSGWNFSNPDIEVVA